MCSLRECQQTLADALMHGDADASWGIRTYRNNAYGNWAGALAGAYPILRKIVGAEFFGGMARHYAREFPSRSGDLNEYGAFMPEFAAAFEPTQDLPYLPDVARMEWLVHRAHFAPDAPPFVAFLISDWPLARIWEVHQDDYGGAITVCFTPGPHHIAILRPRWKPEVQAVSLEEYRLLAELCASANEAVP